MWQWGLNWAWDEERLWPGWGEKAKSNEQLWLGAGHGAKRALNPGGRRWKVETRDTERRAGARDTEG